MTEYNQEIIESVNKIEDTWILKAIYRFIIGMTKENFCKAARIERQPMSKEWLEMILDYITAYLGMILMFALS